MKAKRVSLVVLSSVFLFSSCQEAISVTCFPLSQEGISPILTRLEVTAIHETGDIISQTIEDISSPLPLSFSMLATPVSQEIEVKGFAGDALVYRGVGTLSPRQRKLRLSAPLCANGVLEAQESLFGEACDDGNLISGDGCDTTCEPTGCNSGVPTEGEICFSQDSTQVSLSLPRPDSFFRDGREFIVTYPQEKAIETLFLETSGDVSRKLHTLPILRPSLATRGDVDNDGKKELFLSGIIQSFGEHATIQVFREGEELEEIALLNPIAKVSDMKTGDFNGDGEIDLAVTCEDNKARVFFGNGDASFLAPISLSTGNEPLSLAVVDLDQDGKDEILTANFGSGNLSLFFRSGQDFVKENFFVTGGNPTSLTFEDIDQDGFLDLVVGHVNGISLARNVSDFDFQFFTLPLPNFVSSDLSVLRVSDGEQLGISILDTASGELRFVQSDGFQGLLEAKTEAGNAVSLFTSGSSFALSSFSDLSGDALDEVVVLGNNEIEFFFSNP